MFTHLRMTKGKFTRQLALAVSVVACLVFSIVPVPAASGIKWYDYEAGMSLGKEKGKKIYINFYSDWCTYCRTMENKTFVDPSVVSFLNENFIAIRVNSETEKSISRNYRVMGLPDNWFMMEDGQVIGHRPGFIPPDAFFKILKTIYNQSP